MPSDAIQVLNYHWNIRALGSRIRLLLEGARILSIYIAIEAQFKSPQNEGVRDFFSAKKFDFHKFSVVFGSNKILLTHNVIFLVFLAQAVVHGLLLIMLELRAEHDYELNLILPYHLPEFWDDLWPWGWARDERFFWIVPHQAIHVAGIYVLQGFGLVIILVDIRSNRRVLHYLIPRRQVLDVIVHVGRFVHLSMERVDAVAILKLRDFLLKGLKLFELDLRVLVGKNCLPSVLVSEHLSGDND